MARKGSADRYRSVKTTLKQQLNNKKQQSTKYENIFMVNNDNDHEGSLSNLLYTISKVKR